MECLLGFRFDEDGLNQGFIDSSERITVYTECLEVGKEGEPSWECDQAVPTCWDVSCL